jgi:acetyl-CoA decarbonylase/synthase complex subunit delta
MPLDSVKESWSGRVSEVTLGATAADGGTRTSTVTIGGHAGLPFLAFETADGNRPVVAMEVWDMAPKDWTEVAMAPFADVAADPAAWAKKCVDKFGAEMICLRMLGAHPDNEDSAPAKGAEAVKAVLGAVGVPLIIWGCGHAEKDNELMPACSQAAGGERCLLGSATQDNYRTLVVSCQADGHFIIGESPLDINIEKQVNILISDMGFPFDRIVIYPTTGALGYGLEYAYSIMERTRLAALTGDRTIAQPILAVVGSEAWRAKECKGTQEEQPQWGPEAQRGPAWEAATAAGFIQAGADIVVMRHPEAVAAIKRHIDSLLPATA